MICPHCGMNTGNSEKCVYCFETTEFARRTKVRPERIPNMNDLDLDLSARSASTIHMNSIILIVAVIITFFAVASSVFFSIRYKQLLLVENDAGDVAEFTEASVLSTEQQPLIYLYSNCDDLGEADYLTIVTIGENIPVFPDREDRIFSGWNTERDGTGMAFRAGDPFVIHIVEDLSLYAQWEIKTQETVPVESAIENETIPEATDEGLLEVIDETTMQSLEDEDLITDRDNGVNIDE